MNEDRSERPPAAGAAEKQANKTRVSEAPITAEMMLPDVLRAYPHLRAVFDRYGLRGCGGSLGPAERVEYFARAHGVDVRQLVDELNAAARDPQSVESDLSASPAQSYLDELADGIYRRFFKAGLIVVMTAGAVWGAILLLRIAFSGSFTAIPIHEINAHGHAQIFGWVGLFVMGFAYQAFPRMKHTSLWRPDLANMTFFLMVFGIFARAVGEPLFQYPLLRELAVAGNFAEIAAIGLFIAIILRTLRGSGKPLERHDAFIIASLAFFFVQAVYDLGLLYATTAPALSYDRLIYLVSIYQGPLRDIQIHGFALLMILGVGLRMFPALFGMHAPRSRTAWLAFGALLAGVSGEVVFFILMRRIGGPVLVGSLYASMVLVAVASVALTWRWGLLARPTERDRSVKFVRTAVAWLHVSMALLVLMPVYMYGVLPAVESLSHSGQRAVEIGFSHAYGGAVRHAITVGFISLMILGMAAKVVPTLNGVDIRQLRGLWIPFVLVNVGCLMRVGFQIGTDFAEWAYPVIGMSGLLEVTGIGIWGVHLWRVMDVWRAQPAVAPDRPSRITAEDKVGWIVEWFPATLPVLLERGFAPLKNPVMRRTVARVVPLKTAARQHNLDVEALVAELNAAAGLDAPTEAPTHDHGAGLALPVVGQ